MTCSQERLSSDFLGFHGMGRLRGGGKIMLRLPLSLDYLSGVFGRTELCCFSESNFRWPIAFSWGCHTYLHNDLPIVCTSTFAFLDQFLSPRIAVDFILPSQYSSATRSHPSISRDRLIVYIIPISLIQGGILPPCEFGLHTHYRSRTCTSHRRPRLLSGIVS